MQQLLLLAQDVLQNPHNFEWTCKRKGVRQGQVEGQVGSDVGEDDYDDISDEDMDPSPTNPLDSVNPSFRYEPQMVRLERWHYPRRPLPFDEEEFDVQDPRFRRWLEANTGPIEEVD